MVSTGEGGDGREEEVDKAQFIQLLAYECLPTLREEGGGEEGERGREGGEEGVRGGEREGRKG